MTTIVLVNEYIGGTNYAALTREDREEGRDLRKKGSFQGNLQYFTNLSQNLGFQALRWYGDISGMCDLS